MKEIETKTLEKKRFSIKYKYLIHQVDKQTKDVSVLKTVGICFFVVIMLLLCILLLKGYIALNKSLLRSVEEGDIQAVQRALKNGANVNAKNSEGELEGLTALMIASFKGHTEVAELLITRGAHINTRISESNEFAEGTTTLMLATIMGRVHIVKLLLESGANVNAEDGDGRTALSYATKDKQPYADVIKTFLNYAKEGKQPNTIKIIFEDRKAGSFEWTEKDARQALTSFYVKYNPVFWGCNSDPSTPPAKEEELQCLDYQTFLEKGWGRCSIISYAFQKYTGLKKEGRYKIVSITDYLTINGLHYADHDVTILQIEDDEDGNSQYALIDSSLGWVITCSGLSPDGCIREWGKRTRNHHISGIKDNYTTNGWNKLKFLINDTWSITDNDQGETIPKHLQNSSSDGSVNPVKQYLKANLYDPSSIQYVEWSNVIEDKSKYWVRCTYHIKDYFGNDVPNNHVFVMTAEGQVMDVFNYTNLQRQLNI